MKQSAVLMMVTVCSFLTAAEPEKNKDAMLTLECKVGRPAYSVGEKVQLDFALINKSAQSAEVPTMDPLAQYSISIFGPSKKPVAHTAEGEQLILVSSIGETISGPSSALTPGGSRKYAITELNRIFDLSLCGKYTIKMSIAVPGTAKGQFVEIISNEIEIIIVEPDQYQLIKKLE